MSLTSLSVTDLLDAFASSAPTPGGGSAAALAGAMGASLLEMVARMPKTKNGTDEERTTLDAAAERLATLRADLTRFVDEDTAAYDQVTGAFKLPKGTDEEKAARSTAIQAAMRAATEAPLKTMRACAETLKHAATVAAHGNPNASSDVEVGTALAKAGLFGADKNVEINLGSLKDEAYRDAVAAECANLRTQPNPNLPT